MRYPGPFLSRRAFLHTASAATAQEWKRDRVVILGAGLAGLTVALELQNLGFAVTVLEAQARSLRIIT